MFYRICLPFFLFLAPAWPQAIIPATLAPTVPQVIFDSATAVDYPALTNSVKAIERTSCKDSPRRFDHSITVAELVGAKVKAIRVLHYARRTTAMDPNELQRILASVWQSTLEDADCGIVWSEMTFWSIEGSLEFEDGKTGLLVTDGSHVALRDHDSKSWFFRIPPPTH
jgi:hypothetical protein